jgi:polysaccharide pyruvyl transferase WcaK-like protein
MLETNLEGLQSLFPSVRITVLTPDLEWTRRRYQVDAAPVFGFARPSSSADRQAMLRKILVEASAEAVDHPAVRAIADADAVVISGGGNLSSTWPDLLFERIAVLELARRFAKPVVVLGQTIGPVLANDERHQLLETLATARLVGVREIPSAVLLSDAGFRMGPVWYQCDDALVPQPPRATPLPTIAVTIDPQFRASDSRGFDAFVGQLRSFAMESSLSITLVPHMFGGEATGLPSDSDEAEVIATRLDLPGTTIAYGLDARQARELAANASLIVSTRYHPIVFGLAAGVPSLAIHGDEYCRVKVQGALAHAGLDRWTLNYDQVANGEFLSMATKLWRERREVAAAIESHHASWQRERIERWEAVGQAITTQAEPSTPLQTLFRRPVEEVTPALVSALVREREAARAQRQRVIELARRVSYLRQELGPLRTARRYTGALLRALRLKPPVPPSK